ncbi:MAG TPA: hypothetical protein VD883_02280 [Candidatus Omnitrophota bacterium]|nr:hypothetical protein [Candidatus Omnitrophota bacterium]
MANGNDVKLRTQIRRAIAATQKALKKHIGLIKKRERITSIVALLEILRGDLTSQDMKAARQHLKKLNELTKGFVERAIQK